MRLMTGRQNRGPARRSLERPRLKCCGLTGRYERLRRHSSAGVLFPSNEIAPGGSLGATLRRQVFDFDGQAIDLDVVHSVWSRPIQTSDPQIEVIRCKRQNLGRHEEVAA